MNLPHGSDLSVAGQVPLLDLATGADTNAYTVNSKVSLRNQDMETSTKTETRSRVEQVEQKQNA